MGLFCFYFSTCNFDLIFCKEIAVKKKRGKMYISSRMFGLTKCMALSNEINCIRNNSESKVLCVIDLKM